MNTESPRGKGKALGAPVAAFFVALVVLAAVFAYASFSPRQGMTTSSSIAVASTTQPSSLHSSSGETSSTSSATSATGSSSSSNGIITFRSMPTTNAPPPPPTGAFDPVNGDFYRANFYNGTVSVISSSTNKVVSNVRVVGAGVGLETPTLDPQNGDVYVPVESNFVAVISGATNTVVTNVTAGEGLFIGAVFDPINGEIYLTNDVGQVFLVSGETNTVVGTLALNFGTSCDPVREVPLDLPCSQSQDGASNPVFVPANGYFYVSNGGGDTVSVISGATNSLVTNIQVGEFPEAPLFDPANGDLYVPNYGFGNGDTVSVISSATDAVITTVTVGVQPEHALINPTNGDIYVTSATQDSCGAGVCVINSTLSIISGATNAVVGTVPLCMDPGAATVDSTGNVYVTGCQDGTTWEVYSTTAQSSATGTQRLGELLPECGTPFNTLMNPAPKGTVYVKVVTNQGTVVTNGTLEVTQAGSFGTMNYCISMSDINGTGYIQLAPVNFSRPGGNFIASGYYNVTLWVGYVDPSVTNNPPPSYWATIPSIQVQPNTTIYVTVSAPSGVVTMVTSNEGSGAVTTRTTLATTTKVTVP